VTRAVRAGLRICEVPSQEAPRRYGESNLHTFRDGWRVLRTMLAEWRGSMPQSTTAIPLPIAGDEVRAVEELVVPKQLIHTRSDMRSSQ
jgi:hypothetical protein